MKNYTQEERQYICAAVRKHLDEGCSERQAWILTRKEFSSAGKFVPSLRTVNRWLDGGTDEPSEQSPVAEPSVPDDYTRRLEIVCRMYRTHSEISRDDVCDHLLPDLCIQEVGE